MGSIIPRGTQELDLGNVILLGTTTVKRMLSGVYDEENPLHECRWWSRCQEACFDYENNPSVGDDTVYVYYHPKRDKTVMTTAEDDIYGIEGSSSAGFKGKVEL